MARQKQKSRKSKTVRIYLEPKKRLQKVMRRKADREARSVTEAELVSEAVARLCDREERKLGLV